MKRANTHTLKIAYWLSTAALCVLFGASAVHPRVWGFFLDHGFPSWIVLPVGVAKTLGVIAVLSRRSEFLKELAYAGFAYNALIAIASHFAVRDGLAHGAIAALLLTGISWRLERLVFGKVVREPVLA